eukprot:jgi/Mesen1/1211/ME000128S00178
MKYVVVTGGVVSGLGKGVTASSIGVVLKACGLKVTSIKIGMHVPSFSCEIIILHDRGHCFYDPYINIDAGTMSPFEHGEVFVLDDGGEVDLDLGNYERFLDVTLTKENNITTGKIYKAVLERERRGDYLGKTVQVVPHVTAAIQEWIERVAVVPVDGTSDAADVCVIELGGTPLEAATKDKLALFCHVPVSSLPPYARTQVTLRHCCQSRHLYIFYVSLLLTFARRECVWVGQADHVLNLHDVSNIWHIPLLLRDQGGHTAILKQLNLSGRVRVPVLDEWQSRALQWDTLSTPVSKTQMGGTMRLGARRTLLTTPDCLTAKLYREESFINERHRHRYEVAAFQPEGAAHPVNPEMVDKLEAAGLRFVGRDESGRRMEVPPRLPPLSSPTHIVEVAGHCYYVAVQFHPEFKSRPGKPSPVFLGLVLAASKSLDAYFMKPQPPAPLKAPSATPPLQTDDTAAKASLPPLNDVDLAVI